MLKKKKQATHTIGRSLFPTDEVLNRLAISENGFVFDPSSGNSFTINPTGLFIINQLKNESDTEKLMAQLLEEYDVTPKNLERDILEFSSSLREWLGRS